MMMVQLGDLAARPSAPVVCPCAGLADGDRAWIGARSLKAA